MRNLDYGVIGNCKSAALISKEGTIEWCCLPSFNSPAVFAKILDRERGGEFGFVTSAEYSVSQTYLPKTNVLSTVFANGPDSFEVIDFMPRYKRGDRDYHCPPDIIRYIRPLSGAPQVRIRYAPRPFFGQYPVKTELLAEFIKTLPIGGPYETVYLYSNIDLVTLIEERPLTIDRAYFMLLSYNQKLTKLDLDFIELELEKTKVYWMDWSARTQRFDKYNEEILRSALVLKLLTYQNSGAILAALTTSLPEEIGGERNWDYRYCWLRDASMTIAVLTKLKRHHIARRFMDFLLAIIPYKDEKIQIMYGIHGEKRLTEKILDWLEGYEYSKPVRIGNAAHVQRQNDIYGVLIDAIYQYLVIFKHDASDNLEELWTVVRTLARHLERTWFKKDDSIWEFRTTQKHFTFSKMLGWVGMDRAMRIAAYFNRDDYVKRWEEVRRKSKADILARGWDPSLEAFTQAYGEPYMDAANLLMAHYGFIEADDPKYIGTVLKTRERLCRDGLMYRYRTADDFGVPKSSFTICTFWFIKSLYMIGKTEEAEEMFDRVLSYRNHVGLLSEDIEFDSKRLLGNFPQAYSHLALIDTAITLMRPQQNR
jgi:GH15 family glucan-1,4-alpha-glucosidase